MCDSLPYLVFRWLCFSLNNGSRPCWTLLEQVWGIWSLLCLLQLHGAPDVTVGGLVSIPWCIITHDTCNAATGLKTIWAFLIFYMDRARPEAFTVTVWQRLQSPSLWDLVASSGENCYCENTWQKSNRRFAHIGSRNIFKDSSWTPLEYLWTLINVYINCAVQN